MCRMCAPQLPSVKQRAHTYVKCASMLRAVYGLCRRNGGKCRPTLISDEPPKTRIHRLIRTSLSMNILRIAQTHINRINTHRHTHPLNIISKIAYLLCLCVFCIFMSQVKCTHVRRDVCSVVVVVIWRSKPEIDVR